MNATKHTPGPWKILDTTRCNGYEIFRIGGNNAGGSWAESITSGDRDANARLIAAAPELLEALLAAIPELPTHDHPDGLADYECPALRKARAAIAKATGTTTLQERGSDSEPEDSGETEDRR